MVDIAGKDYWDTNWKDKAIPPLINHNDSSIDSYVNSEFCKIFDTVFLKHQDLQSIKVLEVGCANSIWLPYFKKRYDCNIYGIDYSENGLELEKQILKYYNIDGELQLGDMFNPPTEMINCFDIVFSFGVVEHFDDTENAINSLSRFLKKGGTLITVIPNMQGITGLLQKRLNEDTYLKHVVLDKHVMQRVHINNNFSIKYCDYFLPINLSVINIENLADSSWYKLILRTHSIISKLVWILDRTIIKFKSNKITSPYILVISDKG